MRTWKAVVFGIVILSLAGLAADKVVVSQWASSPLAIDGKADDWAPDGLEAEKDYAISYGFKNDATNLYLFFKFNDAKKYMSSIEQTGFTVWVNAEGKEKKIYGLKFYRKPVTGEELVKILEQQGQVLDEAKKQEIRAKPQYVLFACDAMNKKGEFVPHPSGAHLATYRVARAANTASYELVIPFDLLSDPSIQAKLDLTKPVKIGFEWGGATPEQLQAAAARIGDQGAAASSGGGGDLGSYMGGGEGGGGFNAPGSSLSSMRRSIPKKYDFWANVQVSQKPQ
jgi:hypothetical protein